MSEEATVRMPVTVSRDPRRDKSARWSATYGEWPHSITAEGPTAAEAVASLTAAIATAVHAILQPEPQFATADDGAFHVAIPDHDGGSRWYRVIDGRARLTTYSSQPTNEAFSTCVGMTVIPNR